MSPPWQSVGSKAWNVNLGSRVKVIDNGRLDPAYEPRNRFVRGARSEVMFTSPNGSLALAFGVHLG